MVTASVIITSYNYAAYLRQAIESALGQNYEAVEVIVVDDGSTDDSPQIIRSYGQRVRAIFKCNGGQASSLNAGFAASRGQVLIFLDSDDAVEPEAVQNAVALVGASVSKAHWPLREMTHAGERRRRLVPGAELPRGELRDAVLRQGPRSDDYLWPPTSGNAWSRSFLERVMPMPEATYRTCPDLYLCALAPLYGAIEATPRPLGLWRVHGENHTWKEPFVLRVQRYVKLWEDCCADLQRHARQLGLAPQSDRWKQESWWHRLERSVDELCRRIPKDASFVLIDDDQWACRELEGREALPLISEGGAPADDAHAITELHARRSEGARFLVVAWPAFWWFDHYAGFTEHLRGNFSGVLRTQDLVVFNLTSGDRTDG